MIDKIVINPNICHGKPTIQGTRVLVSNILGALGAGQTIEDILEDYPNISHQHILAALSFGAELAQFEESAYETQVS